MLVTCVPDKLVKGNERGETSPLSHYYLGLVSGENVKKKNK